MNKFQNNKKEIWLIILFLALLQTLNCKEKKLDEIKKIVRNKEITILGGIEKEKTNFLLLGLDVEKISNCGNVLLIIFNDKYKVVDFAEYYRNSTNLPIDYTKDYLAFYLRPNKESSSHIIVYNVANNIFQEYKIGYPFLWNIYIKDNNLFFSTYMANPNLNVIDLKQQALMPFSEFECGSVNFGIYNETVYGGLKRSKYLYKWNGFNFEETQEIAFEDLKIRNRYLKDLPIEDSILYKLKIK